MRTLKKCQSQLDPFDKIWDKKQDKTFYFFGLWRTAFSLLIYIYVVSCLANYGASEAVYLCVVVEEIHEYF